VGFIRVSVAGAQDAANPSLTAVSVPFYGAASYAGAVTGLGGAQSIVVSGAGWTANQFVSPPTFCRIKSGAGTGAFFPVVSNTTTQLNLSTGSVSLVSGTATTPQQVQVLAGDKIELVPANTLGGVFGAGTVPFQTGVKSLDLFTPVGRGQRLGIFAGSGVGKSTLLGMIARGAESEINVIALVGERGRELREFIEKDLGPEGMARSIIVVSTSDQPALIRRRAALIATAIAEHFRDEGKKVLFMMDSVTRYAMAQREIGLAVGEPPTSRGYTPSVFSVLPRLLERTGNGERGSITALYTVLVDGDDMNEPISDAVRGILDGHVVLSRALATANHFPAVDVLESVSRVTLEICAKDELASIGKARDLLATFRKHEDVITIGAYTKGSNAQVDQAIEKQPVIRELLRQPIEDKWTRDKSFAELKKIVG